MSQAYNEIGNIENSLKSARTQGKIILPKGSNRLIGMLDNGKYIIGIRQIQDGNLSICLNEFYKDGRENTIKYLEKHPRNIKKNTHMIGEYTSYNLGNNPNQHNMAFIEDVSKYFKSRGHSLERLKDLSDLFGDEGLRNHYFHTVLKDFEKDKEAWKIYLSDLGKTSNLTIRPNKKRLN